MAKQQISTSLKETYNNEILVNLMKQFNLKNKNQVTKLSKIVINSGIGSAKDDKKILEVAENTFLKITGQKPVKQLAKKSIASFKLREGNVVGLKVTLRNDYMYDFLYRLIHLVLPRLRDFHGISDKAFDKQGNYSLGLHDQTIFPELSFEETSVLHGLQINFVFDHHDIEMNKSLMREFGIPFVKENK